MPQASSSCSMLSSPLKYVILIVPLKYLNIKLHVRIFVFRALLMVHQARSTNFIFYCVFQFWYLVFLGLYTYVILFHFGPTVSVPDIVLMLWVLAFFTEEVRQVRWNTKRSTMSRCCFRGFKICSPEKWAFTRGFHLDLEGRGGTSATLTIVWKRI